MKKTKNLLLSLFEAKDKFDYKEINANMEKIDESLPGGASSHGNMTTHTVTLTVDSWLTDAVYGYIYRVPIEGVTADPTKSHVFYSVPSDIDAEFAMEIEKVVSNCWIRLSEQGDDYVVFKSLNGKLPAINIIFNILVVSV